MTKLATNIGEMTTLTSCIRMVESLGFKAQFQASKEGLQSLSTQYIYFPAEIKIVNFYRFEGASNPEDNCILYAIEANNGERGTLVNAYGAGNDSLVSNFILEVENIHKKIDKE